MFPPPFDPANPLYYRRVLSIYTIYVSGKLGQGGNDIPKAEEDEWSDSSMEKIYSNEGHLIILKYLHHVTYVR